MERRQVVRVYRAYEEKLICALVALYCGHEDLGIPYSVKIGLFRIEGDVDLIAAAVVIVADVQGLVKIADEVHHELQRLKSLAVGQILVRQLRGKLLELRNDAVVAQAIARRIINWHLNRYIDEVPGGRLRPLCPDFIGSVGDIGQRVCILDRQQGVNLVRGVELEVLLGDVSDDAMTFGAPDESHARPKRHRNGSPGGLDDYRDARATH